MGLPSPVIARSHHFSSRRCCAGRGRACERGSGVCAPHRGLEGAVRIAQGRLADAWDWAHEHHVTAAGPPAFLAESNQLTLARLLIGQYRADRDESGSEQARIGATLLSLNAQPHRP